MNKKYHLELQNNSIMNYFQIFQTNWAFYENIQVFRKNYNVGWQNLTCAY